MIQLHLPFWTKPDSVEEAMSGYTMKYFSMSELSRTSKVGIDNVPDAYARNNLLQLTQNLLDPLRAALGKPIRVTSGYRSRELNAAIGGSKTSAHLNGLAVDVKVNDMTSQQLCDYILYNRDKESLEWDQLIWYAPERGGHLHIGYALGRRRFQVLHAPKAGGYLEYRPTV